MNKTNKTLLCAFLVLIGMGVSAPVEAGLRRLVSGVFGKNRTKTINCGKCSHLHKRNEPCYSGVCLRSGKCNYGKCNHGKCNHGKCNHVGCHKKYVCNATSCTHPKHNCDKCKKNKEDAKAKKDAIKEDKEKKKKLEDIDEEIADIKKKIAGIEREIISLVTELNKLKPKWWSRRSRKDKKKIGKGIERKLQTRRDLLKELEDAELELDTKKVELKYKP